MAGTWALVDKDGLVTNVIVWDGPEKSPMELPEGIYGVEVKEGKAAYIGGTYKNGIFNVPVPPPLTEAEEVIERNAKIANNIGIKAALMSKAREQLDTFQDAVDLGMATDKETRLLPLWKQYRVLLNRIDANTPDEIDWPEKPV